MSDTYFTSPREVWNIAHNYVIVIVHALYGTEDEGETGPEAKDGLRCLM